MLFNSCCWSLDSGLGNIRVMKTEDEPEADEVGGACVVDVDEPGPVVEPIDDDASVEPAVDESED